MNNTPQLIFATISGAMIWEGFKFFYPDIKQYFKSRNAAKKVFYNNLDPILKASSELYGKIESLAKEDFATFVNLKKSNSTNPIHNQKYILYLFAQFWAQLEYLRLQSQYIDLSKIKEGNQLLRFIETIESKRHRILDRSMQRIIGECLISNNDQKFRIMTLKDFLETIENENNTLSKWIGELEKKLLNVNYKEQRQVILRFGVIVAVFIDHFDPKHKNVRRREIYKHRLSPRSKELLNKYLFGHYLKFIKNKDQYYQ
jgi:chaperonin cofactor prefoldin